MKRIEKENNIKSEVSISHVSRLALSLYGDCSGSELK